MAEEFDNISSEIYLAESKLYRLVTVDDSFPDYIAKLKAFMSELLLRLHPLCQRSKYKQQEWERFRTIYDNFAEKADAVWQLYSNRDLNRAIQPLYKFDGREFKKSYYVPARNCEKYCEELKDAIAFIQTGDPKTTSDVETVKKHFAYHHRGYLYLSTTEAENKIGKKVPLGRWKELKRLSEEYERLSNIFISQGKKTLSSDTDKTKNLRDDILRHLQEHPGAKAIEMARAILGDASERRTINQCITYDMEGLLVRLGDKGGYILSDEGKKMISPAPSNNGKSWSQEDDSSLKDMFAQGLSYEEMANKLHRTLNGIYYHLATLKLITERDTLCNSINKTTVTKPNNNDSKASQTNRTHRKRITWIGEIVLAYLYKHPGATIREMVKDRQGVKSEISKCFQHFIYDLIEKDPYTGGYRLNQAGENEIRPHIERDNQPEISLDEYKTMLQQMNRSKKNGQYAPHKVILMLSVMGVCKKRLRRVFKIDAEMKTFFMDFWNKYVHTQDWSPNINMPWEHMGSEQFWHWVDDDCKEAYLDEDLYYLIWSDKLSRLALKHHLESLL